MSQALKTTSYVNKETGEVEYEVSQYHLKSEPSYFKLYVQDLAALHKLSKTASNVLYQIAARMDYRNTIILIKPVKQLIGDKVGISVHAVEKAIKELYKEEFLLKVTNQRSVYVVNPTYFAKGKWKDVQQLKLSIVYEGNKRYLITEAKTDTLSV